MAVKSETDAIREADAGKIIEIGDFGKFREKELEEWLECRMFQIYGDRSDIILKNHILRITTKFDALNKDEQYELLGYVKCAAVGKNGRLCIRQEFRNFLEMAAPAWEEIEKFADMLMYKNKTYKQEIMC